MRRALLAVLPLALLSCSAPPPSGEWTVASKSLLSNSPTYSLKLEYPVLKGAPEAFNAQIATAALTHLEQVEDDPIPFEEFAKNLGNESAGQKWAFESTMTVAWLGPATVTTLSRTSTDTGTGQPSLFHHYEVYDRTTGRRLELSDLVEDGKLDALRALAKVTGDFPNEPEIGLLKDTLVFRPDADGLTVKDSPVPYSELKGILKSKYLP